MPVPQNASMLAFLGSYWRCAPPNRGWESWNMWEFGKVGIYMQEKNFKGWDT